MTEKPNAPPPPSFMTLRDFFAGQALNGLLSHGAVALPYQEGHEKSPARAADLAFAFADAMIARRNKT